MSDTGFDMADVHQLDDASLLIERQRAADSGDVARRAALTGEVLRRWRIVSADLKRRLEDANAEHD